MGGRKDAAAAEIEPQKSMFIFGLGFVGTRLANALVEEGWRVAGSMRHEDDAQQEDFSEFQFNKLDERVQVYQIPLDPNSASEEVVLKMLDGFECMLFTAPVNRKSGQDPFLEDSCIRPALIELAEQGKVDWAGYLSTTSVYGNQDGAWVDENTPLMPSLRRGEMRLKVEQSFLFETGLPMHIFRLPGIYGPGRGPISRIRLGQARCIVKEGQVFSRIHVDDIVGVLKMSLAKPNPGRAYNVTDDEPTMNHEVTEYACELMGVPKPPREDYLQVKASMSKMSLSFFSECKRVSNKRIKEELGYELLHPTYREGLRAQLAEELASGWTILDTASVDANSESGTVSERPSTQLQQKSEPMTTSSTCSSVEDDKAQPGSGGQLSLKSPRIVKRVNQRPERPGVLRSILRWVLTHILQPIQSRLYYHTSIWANIVLKCFSCFRQGPASSKDDHQTTCFLFDNGSLSSAPFYQLVGHAARLEEALVKKHASEATVGTADVCKVVAVSARFSDRVKIPELGDAHGSTIASTLEQWGPEDSRQVIGLPFFLGPSATVTDFVPKFFKERQNRFRLAKPLVSRDGKIAQILVDMILSVAEEKKLDAPYSVVLVDHGSPSRIVNRVRRALAAQLRRKLGSAVRCVVDCSMERRPGPAYDFNEPLLENVFNLGGLESGDVIVAMAFLAPGRHAGEGGDIAEILEDVTKAKTGLRISQTKLIGDPEVNASKINELLVDRLGEVQAMRSMNPFF
eukprot:CAMPEP_0184520120 /NCGR_PEP_ID=MMETSP0198_2-20121128/6995_1 /TAXON_ID=1112570 /ORGANISM="Thraustochytrium sp., Strain LLF1b" /LENGTH=740 /DNA_ID=CAMNT_0026910691 /DNA_START=63 /DNA_END=2285 /DNA_ORIENTATION=+